MILHFAILYVLISKTVSQHQSPCPETFKYDPSKDGSDRWYGEIRYRAPNNLTGVWLHITLDRPADILGNWFGPVSTSDNTIFAIRRQDFVLQAGIPLSVRFFVKYNLAQIVPSLETIKLNGDTICSIQDAKSELKNVTFTPGINQLRAMDSDNSKIEVNIDRPIYNSSSNTENDSSVDDESDSGDFYPGDFYVPQLTARSMVTSPSNAENKPPNCGIVAPKDPPVVVHGGDTWPGQWPWHAALYRSDGIKLVYVCGATLITDQHVIAPAHCVTIFHTKRVTQPNKILVSLGKYNLVKFSGNIQDLIVSDIVIHPEYNHLVYVNDIAVLKLSRVIKTTNFVKPCCLWEHPNRNIIGKEGTVVGWSYNENKNLMQVKMSVVPIENCIFSKTIPDRNYCAEFKGSSACRVKSAGGMVFPRDGRSGQDTVWQIGGINVFSEIQVPCNESRYILFTNVAKYTQWIQEVISNEKRYS